MYKNTILRCAARTLRPLFTEKCSKEVLRTFSASIRPPESVYTGDKTMTPVTKLTIMKKFKKGEPLTMVTAYDYPSAVHVENSDIDMILVGDSAAMVVHGYDTTIPITLDEMLIHCKAVVRGARRPLIIADLPFGSYEASVSQAIQSATQFMKEGEVDAVKMEGGDASRAATARALIDAGISVMGHVGLMPQKISTIGGFRPQAQVAVQAMETIEQAIALQDAGCFSIVLECVPASVGAAVQKVLNIPVIGVGAGPACAGQALVFHDLLGFVQHPHHQKVAHKFCKRYSQVGVVIHDALNEFNTEVKNKTFPGQKYSPYKIGEKELEILCNELEKKGLKLAADAALDEFHTRHDK